MSRSFPFVLLSFAINWSVGRSQTPLPLGKWNLISPREGLPQGFVPAIVQDPTGYVYFATKAGLCRYDGRQFRVFRHRLDGASSPTGNDVERLLADPTGNLWLHSEGIHVDRYDPRTERF